MISAHGRRQTTLLVVGLAGLPGVCKAYFFFNERLPQQRVACDSQNLSTNRKRKEETKKLRDYLWRLKKGDKGEIDTWRRLKFWYIDFRSMVGGVACTRPRCVAHHGGGCHWFAIIGRQEKQKNGDTLRGGHEAFVRRVVQCSRV